LLGFDQCTLDTVQNGSPPPAVSGACLMYFINNRRLRLGYSRQKQPQDQLAGASGLNVPPLEPGPEGQLQRDSFGDYGVLAPMIYATTVLSRRCQASIQNTQRRRHKPLSAIPIVCHRDGEVERTYTATDHITAQLMIAATWLLRFEDWWKIANPCHACSRLALHDRDTQLNSSTTLHSRMQFKREFA